MILIAQGVLDHICDGSATPPSCACTIRRPGLSQKSLLRSAPSETTTTQSLFTNVSFTLARNAFYWCHFRQQDNVERRRAVPVRAHLLQSNRHVAHDQGQTPWSMSHTSTPHPVPLPWSRWPRFATDPKPGQVSVGEVVVDSFWDPDGLQRVTHQFAKLILCWRPRVAPAIVEKVPIRRLRSNADIPAHLLAVISAKSTRSRPPQCRATQQYPPYAPSTYR